MEIADNKPIFKQVSDFCRRQILSGNWLPGEFIVSTKEMAMRLGVNPRTVMKAYDELALAKVIINKRGQGYVVASNGPELLHMLLIAEFENEIIPELLKNMEMCGLSPDQVSKMLQSKLENGADIIYSD